MSITNSWLESMNEPENPCLPGMISNDATNNWLLWFVAGAVVVLVLKNGKKGA